MWGDQNITILTPKTGLLTVLFTEKRYRSINIGSIKAIANIIFPLRVCSISDLRCLTRKFTTPWRVTSVQSLSSSPQIDILLLVPKGIQNLLTIPNSRLLLSLSTFLSFLALLAGSVFFSNPETHPDCAQISINVLKYSNNATVQAPQTGNKLDHNDPD